MSRNPSMPAHQMRQHATSAPTADAVPPGLRAKLAGRLGSDTLCLSVGQLRELVFEYDRRGAELELGKAGPTREA